MRIKLFGNWVDYGDFSAQKFAVISCRYGRWVVLQEGYNCTNRPSIVVEYRYDPHAKVAVEVYASVYRANYGGLEAYLKDCSYKGRIIGGYPCPDWASYCQI
jgi:hypothetical protein